MADGGPWLSPQPAHLPPVKPAVQPDDTGTQVVPLGQPVVPWIQPVITPVQLVVAPIQSVVTTVQPVISMYNLWYPQYNHEQYHLKLVYFKHEFAGMSDKDVEAYLLISNDWMGTHVFLEGVNNQRFCLTLVVEASLWNESLRLIVVAWNGLQVQFRQH